MNCPFCGTSLAKVAAICPSCKIQLPESQLFTYYSAALARDKSLAQPEKRSKLDAIVEKEASARISLLAEAKKRAKDEEDRRLIEQAKSDKAARERHAALAAEARIRREHFFSENGKKIKVWSAVALLSAGAIVGIANYLKPEAPKRAIPVEEVKNEPCIALGNAAKQTINLLNLTLEKNRESGMSSTDIRFLTAEAREIQAELLGTTTGQTNGFPSLEEAILGLANGLGVYGQRLDGVSSESAILKKVTNPIHKLAKRGQEACKSAGFGEQFKEFSGWEN